MLAKALFDYTSFRSECLHSLVSKKCPVVNSITQIPRASKDFATNTAGGLEQSPFVWYNSNVLFAGCDVPAQV